MDLSKTNDSLESYAGEEVSGLICRLLKASVEAVHPAKCIPRYLSTDEGMKFASAGAGSDTVCFGGGKASEQMALALIESGMLFSHGQVNCNSAGVSAGIEFRKCTHPLPDAKTVKNTEDIIQSVIESRSSSRIVFLLSGGASSMLSSPLGFVGLERQRAISEKMMLSGANISEINCVRRHLSNIKGGKLSRIGFPGKITTLIISDVIGNRLEDIGSGPTAPDGTTVSDALSLIKKYGASEFLEGSESELLSGRHETVKPGDASLGRTTNTIVADNSTAVASAADAARSGGYRTIISTRKLTGQVADEASSFVNAARKELNGPGVYVAGGEVLVRVLQNGQGGRCQHFALFCGTLLRKGEYVAAFGTDGRDGNTLSAGGLTTAIDENVSHYLNAFDSNFYFSSNGSSIVTGDTGTNAADVYVYFREQ